MAMRKVFVYVKRFSITNLLPSVMTKGTVVTCQATTVIVTFYFVNFRLLAIFKMGREGQPRGGEALSLGSVFRVFLEGSRLVIVKVTYLLFRVKGNLLVVVKVGFFCFRFKCSMNNDLMF